MKRSMVVSGLAAMLVAVSMDAEMPGATVPDGKSISDDQFAKLHTLIKPQAGEIQFWEIPWLLSISEARAAAAAQGKPILVWSGAGGPPIGLC